MLTAVPDMLTPRSSKTSKPMLRAITAGACCIACVIFLSTAGMAEERPPEARSGLETLILSPSFWTLNRDAFAGKVADMDFRWVSTNRSAARSDSRSLSFQKIPVVETIVRFSGDTVSSVLISFFNKGDVGLISEDEFRQKVTAVTGIIDAATGVKSKDVSRREENKSDRKVQTLVWVASNATYKLESATSKVREHEGAARVLLPEYVNLSIVSATNHGTAAQGTGDGKTPLTASATKKMVKKNADGDVLLDQVPMVDQGQKGYCAAASAERVLRYYGLDITQHVIAQKAGTSEQGTDPKSMVTALKAVASLANLQVKVLEQFDMGDLVRQVSDYNREAKKSRAAEIVLPREGVIDTDAVYSRMDKKIYLQSRNKGRNLERFTKSVQSKIDAGIPVLWGVTLGFVEEKVALPQQIGGHMRLIIGYNAKNKEIIYSDSWGAGHELKRMGEADAMAITTCVFSMEPR